MKSYESYEQLMIAAGNIQCRAFLQMYQFEGSNPKSEEKLNKTKGTHAKKPTILGVGHRVRDYKNNVLGGGEFCECGTHSAATKTITQAFGPKK